MGAERVRSGVEVVVRRIAMWLVAGAASALVAGCGAGTDPATDVGALTATLDAHGHTDSSPATFWFQYALDPSALGTPSGHQTPTRGPVPPNTPAGGGNAPFGQAVGGLSPSTTYYFRVCGQDSQVDACSNVQSLTTADSPTITTFPVPTANAGLTTLTTGRDGALWFTENGANQIGRITTGGQVTEYPVPTANAGVSGIVAGPRRPLWFTEQTADKIGRITARGQVTEFPLPTANAGPADITLGSDGALWFTETNANRIGRITTAGAVTDYPVPTPNAGLSGITAGPDGALWFTESSVAKIGRIATNGSVTEYPMPAQECNPSGTTSPTCNPNGITSGPDGAL